MNIHDFIGTPELQMTPGEMQRRLTAMEMLLGLLCERIEKETGEEVLVQAVNTSTGYKYIFGPTRAEKEAFEKEAGKSVLHPVYGNPVLPQSLTSRTPPPS